MASLSPALASLALLSCGGPAPSAKPADGPAVLLRRSGAGPVRVRVELARTPEDRARGLMHRQQMDENVGMLFLFDRTSVQSFWMKNTLIALDMIFIDENLHVVGVVENAEPLTLQQRTVGAPSRYVLEVNAGFAARYGIGAGSAVEFVNVPQGGEHR